METIMRLSAYERAGLIAAAARNLGLGEAIVEKDLCVLAEIEGKINGGNR